ncbi:MAG: PDZ domain-containing protein [Bauldia sp.]
MIGRRIGSLGLMAFALAIGPAGPGVAQGVVTGVTVTVADWLPGWDPDYGGWGLVRAGAAPGKWLVFSHEATAAVPPGNYDLYLVPDIDHEDWPMKMESDIVVAEGAITEIDIDTGLMIETADWVPPLGEEGFWGAIPHYDPDAGLLNWAFDETPIVLPPGEYDILWDDDQGDDHPPIFIDNLLVEDAFGGVGLELRQENFQIVVVGVVPGGPAEAAGIAAGDVIVAVDGFPLERIPLDFAIGFLRGEAESEVVLSVNTPPTDAIRDVTVTRNRVEPERLVRVGGGVRLVPPPDMSGEDLKGARWGAAFANQGPEDLANWTDGDVTQPLLLGQEYYDIYWRAAEGEPYQLVAEDVDIRGTVVDVPLVLPVVAPPTR